MDFLTSDEAFFTEVLKELHGSQFSADRYQVDGMHLNAVHSNNIWQPYHDLKNPRNRINISSFDPSLYYVAEQSGAIHSSILLTINAETFHMQRWLEESWRINGHGLHADYLCLLTICADHNGWGLFDLAKMKAAGKAMTTVYEFNEAGRKKVCDEIVGFFNKALQLT